MINDETEEFKYILAQKKSLCIISFIGPLNHTAIRSMQKCHEELKDVDCKLVALNFRDVTEVGGKIYRDLVQLQNLVRTEKEGFIKVCGMRPVWKAKLLDEGIIRSGEIVDNIRVAIIELSKLKVAG